MEVYFPIELFFIALNVLVSLPVHTTVPLFISRICSVFYFVCAFMPIPISADLNYKSVSREHVHLAKLAL